MCRHNEEIPAGGAITLDSIEQSPLLPEVVRTRENWSLSQQTRQVLRRRKASIA